MQVDMSSLYRKQGIETYKLLVRTYVSLCSSCSSLFKVTNPVTMLKIQDAQWRLLQGAGQIEESESCRQVVAHLLRCPAGPCVSIQLDRHAIRPPSFRVRLF
jgi:hypothetical protein